MFGIGKSMSKHITVIASNCDVEGDLKFTGDLIVSGRIKGNLVAEKESGANLELNREGIIEGDIRVPRAVICGQVTGDITSDSHVVLAATAQIKGNLYYNLVEVVKGAQVAGNLIYLDTAGKSAAPAEQQSDPHDWQEQSGADL